jgi:hypothetical protein
MTSGTQITVHFARPKCGLGYKATQENVLGNNAGRFERFIASLRSIRGRAFFYYATWKAITIKSLRLRFDTDAHQRAQRSARGQSAGG